MDGTAGPEVYWFADRIFPALVNDPYPAMSAPLTLKDIELASDRWQVLAAEQLRDLRKSIVPLMLDARKRISNARS
jgi:hypothetical protein